MRVWRLSNNLKDGGLVFSGVGRFDDKLGVGRLGDKLEYGGLVII